MTLLAGTVIEAARDEHPLFDDRRHPQVVVRRALSAYHRALCGKALARGSEIFESTQDTTLPLSVFGDGITLPAYQYLKGVEARRASDNSRFDALTLVNWASRFDPIPFPSAYLNGAKMYLTGVAADWTGYDLVRAHYAAMPSDLTTDTGATGTILLPDSALDPLRDHLVVFMARRLSPDERAQLPNFDELVAHARDSEDNFLRELSQRQQAVTFLTREVF